MRIYHINQLRREARNFEPHEICGGLTAYDMVVFNNHRTYYVPLSKCDPYTDNPIIWIRGKWEKGDEEWKFAIKFYLRELMADMIKRKLGIQKIFLNQGAQYIIKCESRYDDDMEYGRLHLYFEEIIDYYQKHLEWFAEKNGIKIHLPKVLQKQKEDYCAFTNRKCKRLIDWAIKTYNEIATWKLKRETM